MSACGDDDRFGVGYVQAMDDDLKLPVGTSSKTPARRRSAGEMVKSGAKKTLAVGILLGAGALAVNVLWGTIVGIAHVAMIVGLIGAVVWAALHLKK